MPVPRIRAKNHTSEREILAIGHDHSEMVSDTPPRQRLYEN
jgi:hypothetical protein